MTRRQRCDQCRFWDSGAEGKGECHRYAPRGPAIFDISRDRHSLPFVWTAASEWCGEFQQSPNEIEKLAARIEEADRENAARDLLASVSRRARPPFEELEDSLVTLAREPHTAHDLDQRPTVTRWPVNLGDEVEGDGA